MLLPTTENYNYHSHTQFCDGRASMEEMAAAAFNSNMEIWGFSPHSPISVESPCNMTKEDVAPYIKEAQRLREVYEGRMHILTGMEVDMMSRDFGPHIDYFQNIPLDYRIGSVHFVPNQDGIWLDCDGRFERFASYLKNGYRGDLRYVVEKYFEQVLTMIELGGFEILGHFDKIAGNASLADPSIEEQGWYKALVEDVVRKAFDAGIIVEINTKSIFDKDRYFPASSHWSLLFSEAGKAFSNSSTSLLYPDSLTGILHRNILINSDAHYPEKVNLGRMEAIDAIKNITL